MKKNKEGGGGGGAWSTIHIGQRHDESCRINSKKSLGALLEIRDRDLFKGLGVFQLERRLGKNPEVFGRRKKS